MKYPYIAISHIRHFMKILGHIPFIHRKFMWNLHISLFFGYFNRDIHWNIQPLLELVRGDIHAASRCREPPVIATHSLCVSIERVARDWPWSRWFAGRFFSIDDWPQKTSETVLYQPRPWGADVAESVGVKIQRPGDGVWSWWTTAVIIQLEVC